MMNRVICTMMAIAMTVGFMKAGVVKGVAVDEEGKPVEYATVVALADSVQRAGVVTDSIGKFRMQLPDGQYRLVATSVGYEAANQKIDVNGTTDVRIAMQRSAVMMKEVEVRGSAIRREPDRFVMMVEDMPAAIGKDGKDLLRDAPDVWIDDDRISINGKSGTKVFVNDRELKMSNDQLQAYLKSLKAEDISKVEIIPQSGAEYSADTSAGIIKITMKRNRADGVMGNVGVSGEYGRDEASINPSAALNVKSGKWSFNLNGSYSHFFKQDGELSETDSYTNGMVYNTNTTIDSKKTRYGDVRAGVFFDPNEKNTLGVEAYLSNYHVPQRTLTDATFNRINSLESINGDYASLWKSLYLDVTFNYLHRMDSIGSTMKFIANFSRSKETRDADNVRHAWLTEGYGIPATALPDSVYRSDEHSLYKVANVSYDLNKVFNPRWTLTAGAKYTMNRMDNNAYYDYLKNQAWHSSDEQNYDVLYTENIYALYAKGMAKFGQLSAVAGIRMEYTNTSSRGNVVSQDYVDFFPNAYLTYSLDKAGANSLTLGYSRYISRPSFWALNPIRRQASDYFYQTGNPNLKPAYQNNISLTAVYKYSYSLSLWVDITTNSMLQGSMDDPLNADNILFTTINADNVYNYGASLNLPFQLTNWWSMNANIAYIYTGQRLTADADLEYNNMFFINLNTGFQLPKDFYISASYNYMNRITQGEMQVGPFNYLNASIKKSFANKKWTVAFNANNILGKPMKLRIKSDSYSSYMENSQRASFGLSVTYNFNLGKMFQAKSIEKNADGSRFSKGSSI